MKNCFKRKTESPILLKNDNANLVYKFLYLIVLLFDSNLESITSAASYDGVKTTKWGSALIDKI